MMERIDINDEFFIIDSDNLDFAENRLYGFSLADGEIVQNDDLNNYDGLEDNGAYVLIQRDNDEIRISQDYIGSYGIYVYSQGDYFAVSNSFIRLVDYLKHDHEITLDYDYANAFLLKRSLSAYSFGRTLVNEIRAIPRNAIIRIDVKAKDISYESLENEENSISIDSEEGLKILDNWFEKWIGIIRSLKRKTNNMSFDLSGGFDTRIILALMIASNIDLNAIRIRSLDDLSHTHKEDYEIASEMAEHFGFKLNRPFDVDYINYRDVTTVLDISSYVKLGFTNQLNFRPAYPVMPTISISGNGGGTIRGYPNKSRDEYVRAFVRKAYKYDQSIVGSVERIITEGIDEVARNVDEDLISAAYYKQTRLRNHFGKLTVEHFLHNNFILSPLIDSDIYKLKTFTDECKDDLLLMTVILTRYCPELLEFKVEGGREYDSQTIEYARKINEMHPYVMKEYERLGKVESEMEKVNDDTPELGWGDFNGYLRRAFKSDYFRLEFEKHFHPNLYDKISKSIASHRHFPMQDAVAAFAIVYVLDAIRCHGANSRRRLSEWFDELIDSNPNFYENPDVKSLLMRFITARVDIFNENASQNAIEVIESSDVHSRILFPDRLKLDNGQGCTIQSSNGHMNLKIRCINDGKLKIKLRGIFTKDKNNNSYPIYIDYNEFKVNGEDIITENTLTWHDNPYVYEKDVKDGEIIDISLRWMPINSSSSSEYKLLLKEIKEQKREIEKLKREKECMINSKSWKMTKPIRKIKKSL